MCSSMVLRLAMTHDDFITGEKFYEIADFVYTPAVPDKYDYNQQVNTFSISKLGSTNIIYTHTTYKDSLFAIIKDLPCRFIIITHNNDFNVYDLANLPTNVIHWFSQNVCVLDERLSSLPIGLENSRWFPDTRKKELLLAKAKQPKTNRNLVYVNHNISTNRAERELPYKILDGKRFATVAYGYNPIDFGTYVDNLYNHKFVVSPPGNGVDTHRNWEALYLGTIPIEKRCPNNTFYEDLPICFVNEWEELTEDFLESECRRINQTTWNLQKLKMSYWTSLIASKAQP